MTLALLALVAVLEAVVWLWRLRAGVGTSRTHAAASTVAVCATRVLWLYAGVGALMEGRGAAGGVVYCIAAGAATYVFHGGKKPQGETNHRT